MSLLMEALKKAEQTKQDAALPPQEDVPLALEQVSPEAGRTEPTFPELALDAEGSDGQSSLPVELSPPMEMPPPSPAPKETPRVELVLEPAPPLPKEQPAPASEPKVAPAEPLAPKSEMRPTEPPARPPQQAAKRPEAAKQQARNVFSAKTGTPKPSRGLPKPIWVAVGVGVALLAAGMGYYFYRELNPPLLALQPEQVASAPAATPVVPAPIPVSPTPATAPPEMTAAHALEESPREPKAPESSDAVPERGDIRIQHGTPAETLNPNLAHAYQAMRGGNLDEALEAYRKVLQSDRNNRDALLGLASLQERRGDSEGAGRLYQRLLELDPNDGAAQAGLTDLGLGDPARAESRLKSLLSKQPDSDALHFALGNLYANQRRWAEAQQSYFLAFQKQPGNPDYLYNLAVSLDHLGQARLARDYYQKALAAANRPHNFSPEEVETRIGALERATP